MYNMKLSVVLFAAVFLLTPRSSRKIKSFNMLFILLKALDLQPQDTSGLADPYLVVNMGKTKISDKENYVPNNLNPLFGK